MCVQMYKVSCSILKSLSLLLYTRVSDCHRTVHICNGSVFQCSYYRASCHSLSFSSQYSISDALVLSQCTVVYICCCLPVNKALLFSCNPQALSRTNPLLQLMRSVDQNMGISQRQKNWMVSFVLSCCPIFILLPYYPFNQILSIH